MWTAVILAGGRSSRMGAEKTSMQLGECSLLDYAISSLDASVPIIVVGDERPTLRDVRFVREEPKYAGPVAGIAAALPCIESERFGLLGGDMPLAGTLLSRLALEDSQADAVVFQDTQGRLQPLCAVFSTPVVTEVLERMQPVQHRSMHEFLFELNVEIRELPSEDARLLIDIDTPAELRDFLHP